MKLKRITRIVFVQALCAVLILMFGAIGASAVEVPQNTTEVSIPIELQSDGAIAGGDVEFHHSSGLEFVKFVPAGGIDPGRVAVFPNPSDPNYAELLKEGRYMIGVFSSKNDYKPIDGGVPLGSLVFKYAGQANETITITETKTDTFTTGNLTSNTTKLDFVIDVTRARSGGTGDGSGTGSGSDTGTGSGSGQNPGTGADSGAGSGSDSAAGSDSNSGGTSSGGSSSVVKVTVPTQSSGTTTTQTTVRTTGTDTNTVNADDSTAPAAANESADSTPDANASLGGTDIPLASQSQAGAANSIPSWIWVIIGALVAVVVILLFLFRKKKKEQTS